jgi:SAM-dependent methyltransferase
MSHEVFDRVAEVYDSARPGYPDGVYDAVAALCAMSLERATVVDVGAGTGIATRGLMARGARVAAIDLGERMLARLVAHSASPGVVVGDGNTLPLRAGVADLVCFAQSWHWLRPADSISEALRVLRPGGVLAAWWNTVDLGDGPDGPQGGGADWLVAFERRLAASCPAYWGPALPQWRVPSVAQAMGAAGLDVQEAWIRWVRRTSVEELLLDLRSHSFVASLGEEGAREVLARERAELLKAVPDGDLEVPMRVYLAMARKGRQGRAARTTRTAGAARTAHTTRAARDADG